jgi:PAS domain S-box-containing protein
MIAERSIDAEQDARKVLEELRATLYSIGDGVIVTDATGHITRMNPVAKSLTGWSEAEAFGKHLDEVFRIANEKSGARVENPAERVLREGKTAGLANDTLLIARDGTERPIADCGAPIFDAQGAIIGVVLVFHDQSAERAAQRALQESEAKFRTIFDRAIDGLLIADVITKKFLHGNPTICSMLGYTKEEIASLTIYDIHPSKDISHVLDAFEKQAKGEKTLAEDLPVLRKDGSIFYADISSAPAIIGGLDCILGVFRDITERKQAEEERKAHIRFLENLERVDQAIKQEMDVEQMLRHILETVFSIFNCDRAWLFYPCDPDAPSFRVPMEIARPEYPGARVLNVDVPMLPDLAQNLREALECDAPVIYTAGTEKPINKVSAEQFGVQSQMFVAIYPKLGKPWAFGMHQCSYARIWTMEEKKLFKEIGRRISDGLSSALFLRELQENEERFRTAFEQAAVGIAHVAPDGRWLRVNRKLCDIVGYSREELLQKKFQDITHPDDLDASLEYVRKVLAGEIQTYGMEKRYIRKDGSFVWIDLTVSIVHHASGEPGYFISVIEDITKRKQAEEEKEKLQDQFLQAQKMESVGRLAGGVAHDFNNMLSAILGHAELAMMRCSPLEPIHADLKVIEDSARRSADLTRQLLAFARKQTVAPMVLDINDTVAGMLKMLLRLIGEDIDLVWMPGSGLWLVRIDPSQIDQLLANLCVNARDAIIGVGKITIETENTAFDEAYCAVHPDFACGEYVMLTVSDDGCGMSKEVLDRLFEPFFTTKEVGKGTGLGLATVYGIVKQNEGFVTVCSEPDKGATFRIYLPRFVGKAMEPTAESTAETPKGNGETVLLVEDEPMILDVSRAMLEQLGYAVLIAGTPGEALRQAKAHAARIQLLITDVVMPEMNGRVLAKMICDIKPGLKCLFISGYTANVIAHRGVLDEGVYFLQKPFSMKDLATKASAALDNNRQIDRCV